MDFVAAIFDMDGVLIDSEPLWWRAEKQAFAEVGVRLSDGDCESTMGMRTSDVVAHWYEHRGWTGRSTGEVVADILERMQGLIAEQGTALPGVYATLRRIRACGVKTALASSSPMELIRAVVAKLDFADDFQVLCSASDEAHGKPDPAVFLTAAGRLGVAPHECFVFEDSIAGVEAGLAAGMTVVAVPAPPQFDDPAFDRAHLKIPSLVAFTLEKLGAAGV